MSQRIVWGHGLSDYIEMFDLKPSDFEGKILEYGCGPSALNESCQQKAQSCLSLDPLFALDEVALKAKTSLLFEQMVKDLKEARAHYDFTGEGGLEGFIKLRKAGLARFFEDYQQGRKEGRYQSIRSMTLPFEDFHFDWVLSAHYLFSGISDQDVNFHIDLIKELTRVAKEVRIFPLVDSKFAPSPLLGPVLLFLQQNQFGVELKTVPWHLQKEDKAMLRIFKLACQV